MSTTAQDLYQEMVLEHNRAPRHFGALAAPTQQARGRNPQCGDDVQVQLRVEDGTVRDIAFSGQGCAICMASASMMTEAVLGKQEDEARALQARFRAVLIGQGAPDDASLGKLASLAGVSRYPGRIKCALLPWHALMHALQEAPGAASPRQEEMDHENAA